MHQAPLREDIPIADRISGGDSFASGAPANVAQRQRPCDGGAVGCRAHGILVQETFLPDAGQCAAQATGLRFIPNRFHDEYDLTVSTISRSFGGFLRGQVVMAVLSGVVTAIAAGLPGCATAPSSGALVGLIVIVPLIGAPIAMILPSIIALVQGVPPLDAIVLLAFLTVFQQILLHFIVPRIMSESIGMPPALTLVSVLIGARLWGMWGFIFGIPVAGAIYSVGLVMLGRFKREQDQMDIERGKVEL